MTTPTTPEALDALVKSHFAESPTEPLHVHGLSESLYRQYPAVNVSSLKPLAKSPKKYRYEQDKPKEQTAAMIFGTCVHAILLEPDRIANMVVTRPAKWDSWRTKESQQWRAEQSALVVTEKELAEMHACAAAVKADGNVAWIFERAKREVAVFKRHKRTDLLLKARLDLPFTDKNNRTAVADIKKMATIDRYKLPGIILDRGYDLQAAFYNDIIGATPDDNGREHFYLLAVEEEEPHDVDIFDLEEWIADGREIYEALLDKLKKCTDENNWPGVRGDSDSIHVVPKPRWAQMRAEELTAA